MLWVKSVNKWLISDYIDLNILFRLEARLVSIFTEVHQTYKSIESRIKAESFKMRVMKIFQAWEDWAVYSKDFLIRVQNAFLGLTGEVSVFYN